MHFCPEFIGTIFDVAFEGKFFVKNQAEVFHFFLPCELFLEKDEGVEFLFIFSFSDGLVCWRLNGARANCG